MQKTGAAGFSLIEILISMLMVAIATLGLVRWQAANIHAARQVQASANAMRLASELADWIRVLPEGFTARRDTDIFDLFLQPSGNPVVSCFYSDCDPDEQINFYLLDWHQRLRKALPDARVVVCRDDQSGDAQMHDWQCRVTDVLTAPLVIKIGWHQAASDRTSPLLVLAVGTVAS